MPSIEVTINIKTDKPSARQLKAWDEFLDILEERAVAEIRKEQDAKSIS